MFPCAWNEPSIFPTIIGVLGTILGTIMGFSLGEGSRLLRYRLKINKFRRIVKKELESIILFQIPWKKIIVKGAVASMEKEKFLSPASVRFTTTGYKSSLLDLYKHLKDEERIVLHIIYAQLDESDKIANSMEADFKEAVVNKIFPDPFKTYIHRLEEVIRIYDEVEKNTKKYLTGEKIDLYKLPGEKSSLI